MKTTEGKISVDANRGFVKNVYFYVHSNVHH